MKKLLRFLLPFLGVASLAAAAETAAPALPRSTPEAQGISSAAILQFIEAADAKVNSIHSFMLVRHGQVVAESWWTPYAAAEPHVLFSLSKSFTSTAIGLAVAEGKLSVDDPVLKFFPDDAPAAPSKNLQAMRVRDLLTMSNGQHDEDISSFPFGSPENLVKKFLSLPVAHKPGTFFVYNTPATYMLSAIVQKVTGKTVLEYLGPRLFEPLGIASPTWDASAQGISLGGFGLSVRTEDIAKFGLLYLQRGQWNGKQLLPAAWIDEATSRRMSNGSDPNGDWDQGYGYQFWRCRHGFYRGDGAHGQFCIVMPQYDAVIAITSGTGDMGLVMNLIWDKIVPALESTRLAADPVALGKLTARLATLSLPTPEGAATSVAAKNFAGKRYVFPANDQMIGAITLDAVATGGDQSFTVKFGGTDQRVSVGHGRWIKGTMTAGAVTNATAASGAWTADDSYTLKLCGYRTPFVTTYRLRFAGDQLFVTAEQNVGFGEQKPVELVGKAE
jgi:CubicO group peptidase (beta-lactamase class C family)